MLSGTQLDPATTTEVIPGLGLWLWEATGYPISLALSDEAGALTGHPFHLWLAHVLGATTENTYILYCLALVGFSFIVVWRLSRRRWGTEVGNLAFGLFLASPVSYILWTSIGLEDGLTVLFTAALLLGRRPVVLLMAGFGGALNHPICAIAGTAVLYLRRLDGERTGPWGWVGIGLGIVVSAVFLVHYSGRIDFFNRLSGIMLLHHHLVFWPLLLYSFGFGLWLSLPGAGRMLWAQSPRYTGVAGAYLLGCAILTIGMLDPTRTFALLSWPVVLHGLMRAPRSWAVVPMIARWGWLAPSLAIWSGELRPSTWSAWLSWIGL